MWIDLNAGEICLAENYPLRMKNARGQCIRCTAGSVWITLAGETVDTILQAGQSHEIQGNGLLLVEGVSSGRIRIENTAGKQKAAVAAFPGKRISRFA